MLFYLACRRCFFDKQFELNSSVTEIFTKAEIPPVNAFWSVTMYKLPTPDGPFALALRIYWPEQDILDG
jgi:hypothetical protein